MSASIGVEKETDAQGRLKRHVDTKLRSIQLNVCHQGKPYWRMQQGKKETNKLELVYRGSIQLNVCHQGKPYWRMQQGKKETNKLELVYRG
ncbi:hypothetical protein T05_12863 [Trichinella murrelli]|uniref:Uncharacterized protein n=1 Tax=Trichinella murrelli TaxID=144512 RepID=A0A0V0U153_9BILA|nr:hypothetical protein T05_12863 [Trichinella murrelli]